MHVITANIIHSLPLNEQLTLVCEWNTYYLQRPGFGSNVSIAEHDIIIVSVLENLSKASVTPCICAL